MQIILAIFFLMIVPSINCSDHDELKRGDEVKEESEYRAKPKRLTASIDGVALSIAHDTYFWSDNRSLIPQAEKPKIFVRSPLIHACRSSVNDMDVCYAMSKILLHESGSLDSIDRLKMSALMHVARSGFRGAIGILLSHHASSDLVDYQGRNALMHAVIGGKFGSVKLLAPTTNLFQQDHRGRFALTIAREMNRPKTVVFLEHAMAAQKIRQKKDADDKAAVRSEGFVMIKPRPIHRPLPTEANGSSNRLSRMLVQCIIS